MNMMRWVSRICALIFAIALVGVAAYWRQQHGPEDENRWIIAALLVGAVLCAGYSWISRPAVPRAHRPYLPG